MRLEEKGDDDEWLLSKKNSAYYRAPVAVHYTKGLQLPFIVPLIIPEKMNKPPSSPSSLTYCGEFSPR